VRRAFAKYFSTRLKFELAPGGLTPAESARAGELERGRYATEAWNRMR
jgi:lipoate-protein ligase A